MLRELVTLRLVYSSFVSVDENAKGTFSLNFKADGNIPEIRAYLSDKDLVLSENKEKGTCSIAMFKLFSIFS